MNLKLISEIDDCTGELKYLIYKDDTIVMVTYFEQKAHKEFDKFVKVQTELKQESIRKTIKEIEI